ncbi:MAG: substrate-binding domain-containing protein [Colwellia sp.]|nr:substrate-binding domain-containing protein [Colwellia sp.]
MRKIFFITLIFTFWFSGAYAESREKCIFLSLGVGDDFWQSISKGSNDAAEKFGYQIIERSVAVKEGDAALKVQNSVLDWSVDEYKCQGIVLAPYDFRVSNKIQALKDLGIITVYVDRDDGTPHVVSSVTTDNKAAGALAADIMSELLKAGASVLLLRESKGVKTTEDRVLGFSQQAKTHGLEIIDGGYVGEIHGDIEFQTENLLMQYYKVDAVFSPNETITLAASYALLSKNKTNVLHVGFDINKSILNAIRHSESIHGVVLQSPYDMGYSAVKIIDSVIKGEAVRRKQHSDFYFIDNSKLTSPEMEKIIESYGVKL